ncbi:MAG: hypothetical protein ACKOX6_11245 [Bdellovibrio sp.]
MKNIILMLVAVSIIGCAKTTTQAEASPQITVTEVTSKVDARLASPDNTTRLEAKIDRLEKLMSYLARDRQNYKDQITKYKSCSSECSAESDKIDWKHATESQQEYYQKIIRSCFKECEQWQPDEIVGC